MTNVTPPTPVAPPAPLGPEEPDDEPPAPIAARPAGPLTRDDPTRALQERWRAAVDAVKVVSTRHGSSLSHGRVLWIRQGEVSIAYTRQAEFHRTVISGSGKVMVEKALSDFFGRPTKLTIETSAEIANAAAKSLAEEETVIRQERERGADRQVRTHPAILSTLRILGGEIEHVQVVEPERPAPAAAASDPDNPDS